MTPASTTPSVCFDINKDSVIFGFCVVAVISASYLNFRSNSAECFELDCFIGSRFLVILALCAPYFFSDSS